MSAQSEVEQRGARPNNGSGAGATIGMAPWRAVTHIEVGERNYALTLECGHLKFARRSVPRAFSITNRPQLPPRRVRCKFCPCRVLP
jgi:hypothetical protein